MGNKITDATQVHSFAGTDLILGNFGNALGQMSIDEFRQHLNDDDNEVLNNLAFYIDVNKPSAKGSTYVDTGGNMNMRQLWEDAAVSILMDANGNYCELNRNDNRYTAEGDKILNDDGTLVTAYAKCDLMKIIPKTYGRVQVVSVGSTTIKRLHLSLVPLPGGFIIPQLVVGKCKASLQGSGDSAVMRSIPGVQAAGDRQIYGFWVNAQNRSKNHGLANLDFRNYLLFYMMSKYGQRDCQNLTGADGTKVWGVGLDGTETKKQTDGWQKFLSERVVKCGSTLSLGDYDGNVAVTNNDGETVHSVNVAGFENPWGQFWEMTGGLCSVGNDVFCWRGNIIPSGTPTADTFKNMDCVKLTRYTAESSSNNTMNIITAEKGQGVYMIPDATASGITYNDHFWYNKDGQLWLFGGYSYNGSACGLAYSYSFDAWSYSNADYSARLAYYGSLNKVSAKRLAQLAA